MGFYWRNPGGEKRGFFLLFVFFPSPYCRLWLSINKLVHETPTTSSTARPGRRVVQNRADQQEVGREYLVPAGWQ
jgi:hypothetical protein